MDSSHAFAAFFAGIRDASWLEKPGWEKQAFSTLSSKFL
jgi:hypothetical protein